VTLWHGLGLASIVHRKDGPIRPIKPDRDAYDFIGWQSERCRFPQSQRIAPQPPGGEHVVVVAILHRGGIGAGNSSPCILGRVAPCESVNGRRYYEREWFRPSDESGGSTGRSAGCHLIVESGPGSFGPQFTRVRAMLEESSNSTASGAGRARSAQLDGTVMRVGDIWIV